MPKKSTEDSKSSFFDEKQDVVPGKKHLLLPIALIILGLSVIIAVFSFIKYQEAMNKEDKTVSEINNKDEVDKFVKEIGAYIELPEEETPTMATVSDVSKLANQPFFKNAQNGDIVLIYNNAKKAILYRPSTKKVIDITTINVGATITPVVSASPSAAIKKIRIVILNGTKESGLARKASDIIEGETVDVIATGNTSEDYQTTSISSIAASNPIKESDLKALIKGITKVTTKVISFPSEEAKPANADVVIILGEDFAGQY